MMKHEANKDAWESAVTDYGKAAFRGKNVYSGKSAYNRKTVNGDKTAGEETQTAQANAAIQEKNRLYISILLFLVALVSVSAASVAWFTIADFTKVHSMSMEITSGINLRFDLDAHDTFDEYVKTLKFTEIAERVRQEQGYDMRTVPLEPVTTEDFVHFTFEHGDEAERGSGAYQEFVLHFMATEDMLVHLTSADTEGAKDGTRVTSENPALPQAMRLSFTVEDKTYVYAPGMGDVATERGNAVWFGLPTSENMVLNDNNAMFWLEKDVDQPVTVRIWLEGTDPMCTDELRNADYSIMLRFIGTDENNNPLAGEGNAQ